MVIYVKPNLEPKLIYKDANGRIVIIKIKITRGIFYDNWDICPK